MRMTCRVAGKSAAPHRRSAGESAALCMTCRAESRQNHLPRGSCCRPVFRLGRGVGPCVVDLRPEGPVQAPLAGGFAPVVGGHRADDRQRTPRPHPPDCPDDAVLADVPDALGDVAPAVAVDHHREPPAPAAPRDDGVHPGVSELLLYSRRHVSAARACILARKIVRSNGSAKA